MRCLGSRICLHGPQKSTVFTEQKMKLPIKDFFSRCNQIPRKLTEEIINGKLHFLCSLSKVNKSSEQKGELPALAKFGKKRWLKGKFLEVIDAFLLSACLNPIHYIAL